MSKNDLSKGKDPVSIPVGAQVKVLSTYHTRVLKHPLLSQVGYITSAKAINEVTLPNNHIIYVVNGDELNPVFSADLEIIEIEVTADALRKAAETDGFAW